MIRKPIRGIPSLDDMYMELVSIVSWGMFFVKDWMPFKMLSFAIYDYKDRVIYVCTSTSDMRNTSLTQSSFKARQFCTDIEIKENKKVEYLGWVYGEEIEVNGIKSKPLDLYKGIIQNRDLEVRGCVPFGCKIIN